MNENSSQKSDIAKREEKILAFWKENNIFEKSLEQTKNSKKKSLWRKLFGGGSREFIFYEGPPTANGRPGIHHVEARAFKDIIPRYKTMRGFHVGRKGGWDTHGLPVELQVEKELGLKSKKDIERFGIAAFNKKCRESVWKYVDEWEMFTDRIGYWIDQKNPYITYEPTYIESLWSILKTVYDNGLLYKDYKVVPWCPRCGTVLSSHELAQGYKDREDVSVYVKFTIEDSLQHNLPENTSLLAWTTTPWTLPGNVALAVGTDMQYVLVKHNKENIIVAKDRVTNLFGSDVEVERHVSGRDLVGVSYKPLYPYFVNTIPESQREKLPRAYKVYKANFVSTEEGTGVVHTAVMYGADDFELGTNVDLPKHHLITEEGKFISETDFLSGRSVGDVSADIVADLKDKGALFKEEKITHTYPHCWRCKTALIYFARDSWYIRMSELRDKLVEGNKKINWQPKHIREGRFGEWIRDVKDWAISRERYWGTPLPIWMDSNSSNLLVIDSIDTFKKHTKKSGNQYFVMRHGEAESNEKHILSSRQDNPHHLTERGKEEVIRAAEQLKGQNIGRIIASPFLRTRETAELVAKTIGMNAEDISYDVRIREPYFGDFEGKAIEKYVNFFASTEEKFTKAPKGGETFSELKNRTGAFLYELEEKHSEEIILIVSHEATISTLFMVAEGADLKRSAEMHEDQKFSLNTGAFNELLFTPLPHNEDFELDLHRPYIDEVQVVSESGESLQRVQEVVDVWFDSGAMPFAQHHYPMENREWVDGNGYPADYISEAIDQTRGWFYTLHAIGTLMNRGNAYKNVISLGHILDSKGKKMSKSVGNVIDPWEEIHKYGADALRFWMYSVNQPGDSKNFEGRTVDEIVKKVLNLLDNIVVFFKLYADDNLEYGDENIESSNILDRWITARLNELISETTKNLDQFNILDPARNIRSFIADLSQWYIRRSRVRFKGNNTNTKIDTDDTDIKTKTEEYKDKKAALMTTHFVLLELSKVIAPFMPFLAEEIYMELKGPLESVHLEKWPEAGKVDRTVLQKMDEVRQIASSVLEQRSVAGIRVRQPLGMVVINQDLPEAYQKLLLDEVNVKEIVIDRKCSDRVKLDTHITKELREEGYVRELIRSIQGLRKKNGLSPSDTPTLAVDTDESGKQFVESHKDILIKSANLKGVVFSRVDEEEVRIGDMAVKLKIIK